MRASVWLSIVVCGITFSLSQVVAEEALPQQHDGPVSENSDRAPASLRRDSLTEREETTSRELSISGIIEVGFSVFKNFDKSQGSDITNDTVQIDIEKKISELATARITLLHEDGSDPDTKSVGVDEAFILLEKESLFLKAGKFYVGAGNFKSEFISDPVTLELAETNENALAIGYRTALGEVSVFTFNGDTGKADQSDRVRSFGAHIESNFQRGSTTLNATISYMSNIAESDSLGQPGIFSDKNADAQTNDLSELTQSLTAGFDAENESFVLHAEYFLTLGNFDKSDLDWSGQDAQISALKLEAGLKSKVSEKEVLFLLGYQSSEEALLLGLPQVRWLTGAKLSVEENIEVSYEFKYEEDYSRSSRSGAESGTGGFANTHSVLLGLSF